MKLKTSAAAAFLIVMSAMPVASQTLTVSVTGSGKVTGTGIDCGTDCSETPQQTRSTVRLGTPWTVVLTASGPGMAARGVTWGGACQAARGPTCTVTVPTGGATVSAVFATVSPPSASGVSTVGPGTISISGTVSGLSGTVVLQNNGGNNLTVSINGGFTFAGALVNGSTYNVTVLTQPTGQTCTITNGTGTVLGANVTNVAMICPAPTYTLSVSKTGSGTVTSSPAGIDCGADCFDNYSAGTVVTLTATARVESAFTGWGGACLGTGTCVVTMDAGKAVSANFPLTTSPLSCQQRLQQLNVNFAAGPARPGVDDPVTVSPPLNGVAFASSGNPSAAIYMDCRLALALHRVAADLVARGIDTVDHLGTWNYRCIAGTGTGTPPDCTMSDHAYGTAIDFASFSGGGTTYSVLNDWVINSGGDTCTAATANAKDELLHRLACKWRDASLFNIIFTPNYTEAFRNHIHVDLTTGASFIR